VYVNTRTGERAWRKPDFLARRENKPPPYIRIW
jgi:hypothetical protein